jgi:hypothetical protein
MSPKLPLESGSVCVSAEEAGTRGKLLLGGFVLYMCESGASILCVHNVVHSTKKTFPTRFFDSLSKLSFLGRSR